MSPEITDAVSMRVAIQLTPGRHALVASQIKARLNAEETAKFGASLAELESAARSAVAFARKRAPTGGTYSEEARDADVAVDATLATIDALLSGYERAHDASTDTGRAARALRARLFPRGLAAITLATFPDELAQVNALIEDAARPDAQALVQRIPGLAAVIEELAPRALRLRTALDREARDGASYRDVVASTARAERTLAELTCGIAFVYAGDAPEAVARRRFLLEPYSLQVAAMRESYRRRVPTDVDPETGAEVPAPSAPIP